MILINILGQIEIIWELIQYLKFLYLSHTIQLKFYK